LNIDVSEKAAACAVLTTVENTKRGKFNMLAKLNLVGFTYSTNPAGFVWQNNSVRP
jgi:hypothetical protein